LPAAWSETGDGAEPVPQWWRAFADPCLDRLMDETLAGNLDLQRAWTRILQAEMLAAEAGASLWPGLTAEGGVSRTRTMTDSSTLRAGSAATAARASMAAGADSRTLSTRHERSLGLAASYELDLWGRVRAQRDALGLAAQAAGEERAALAASLAGRVAELYFAIVEQQAQLSLLRGQEESSRTLLDLVKLRFSQGQVAAVDVYQQEQQVTSIRSQVPLVRARLAVLRHQVAVLMGQPPGAELPAIPDRLPAVGPLPALGIPAERLERRPDVRAARLRVVAADRRVAAAVADRLPALRLTGGGTTSAEKTQDLFKNWILNLATGLSAPLLDGGRRSAGVRRQRAAAADDLLAYGQVLLAAMQEVEDALVQEREQAVHLEELARELVAARAALQESRQRYTNGLTDYLPVLAGVQAVQRLERSQLSAQLQRVAYRIRLCRALGGGWEEERPPLAEILMTPERR